MAIFIELKHFLRYIGLLDFNSPHSQKITIILQAIVLLLLIFGMLPTLVFLQTGSEATIAERIQCLATFLSYGYCWLIFTIILYRKQEFIGMINNLELTIEMRERKFSRTVYEKINAEVEKLSRRVKYFVGGLVVPLLLIPPLTISFYNYFVLGMGEDSFRLFSPMR